MPDIHSNEIKIEELEDDEDLWDNEEDNTAYPLPITNHVKLSSKKFIEKNSQKVIK